MRRAVPLAPASNALRTPLRAQFDSVSGDWAPLVQAVANSPAGQALCAAVDARVSEGARVYPDQVFRALVATPRAQVRVLLLGQDPYHGPGQAEGLAFSVAPDQRWPPSLRNILQEWHRDLGQPWPESGSLAAWAEQGVLLLNSSLTVEDGQPGAHAKLGWQVLTDAVVSAVAESPLATVFMLWGAQAQAWAGLAQASGRHLVLSCNHPSPLSARRGPVPFVGSGHFGQASRFLASNGRGVMPWKLT